MREVASKPMSAHIPLLLQTTPSPLPAATLISTVVRYLSDNARHRLSYRFPGDVRQILPGYSLEEYRLQPLGPRWPSLDAAAQATSWLWVDALIDVGVTRAGIVIRSQPFASYDPRPLLLVELDGSVYDSVYPDMSRRRSFNPEQKKALVTLCLDATAAAGAAGFVLSQEHSPLPLLDLDGLREVSALIKGIRLEHAEPLAQPSRYAYVAQNAWLLHDYFHP